MSEFTYYPGGALANGNGELEHVANAKLDINTNTALVHMLSKSPSGYKRGNKDVSGSFDGEIPATGEEKNWINEALLGTPQTFRFKIPNSVKIIKGVLSTVGYTMAAGDTVKYSIAFVGMITNPEG